MTHQIHQIDAFGAAFTKVVRMADETQDRPGCAATICKTEKGGSHLPADPKSHPGPRLHRRYSSPRRARLRINAALPNSHLIHRGQISTVLDKVPMPSAVILTSSPTL